MKAEAKVQAAALGIKPERIDAALKLADLSGVTVGDDGEPDAAAINGGGSVVTLEGGIGTITLDYTGTWAAADTETLTITGGTKIGYAIANKTSVDTLVA